MFKFSEYSGTEFGHLTFALEFFPQRYAISYYKNKYSLITADETYSLYKNPRGKWSFFKGDREVTIDNENHTKLNKFLSQALPGVNQQVKPKDLKELGINCKNSRHLAMGRFLKEARQILSLDKKALLSEEECAVFLGACEKDALFSMLCANLKERISEELRECLESAQERYMRVRNYYKYCKYHSCTFRSAYLKSFRCRGDTWHHRGHSSRF